MWIESSPAKPEDKSITKLNIVRDGSTIWRCDVDGYEDRTLASSRRHYAHVSLETIDVNCEDRAKKKNGELRGDISQVLTPSSWKPQSPPRTLTVQPGDAFEDTALKLEFENFTFWTMLYSLSSSHFFLK
jgi:hypothetical protein